MKKATAREFYHNAALVDGLAEGEELLVTSNGAAKFIVTRGSRPRMTRELAEKRAVGDGTKQPFDGTAFLRTLKK